jgi:signal transduction histidine kinase/ActR/RegA family two-component response regulator
MENVDPASQPRVLVFTPIGRDGPATADLLQRAGVAAEICTSYEQLLNELKTGPDAAFVAEEGLFGKDLDGLGQWVDSQPAWSDLPFVVLTSRHDQTRVTQWRQTLVEMLGNVSLLERPVQPLTLISVMQAALRARDRQRQVRSLLVARDQAAAGLESLVAQRTEQLQEVNSQLRMEMTERARIEESLRHAQKLEALGQLTGGVAHDFNNLLMVITAGLDMMERHQDPSRRTRMLQGMRQAAQRGASLTRQLLAFSRSHALRPETVDLRRHLEEMKELLDRSLRGDVQVDIRLGPDLWPVQVDPGELELVLLNLAVNARDAMERGGIITIEGANIPNWEGPAGLGDFVSLSVTDTGAGMSDDVKAHVFEPFFTTKDVGKGSGLGLAQVYGFAHQSGGMVEIQSAIGIGTSVRLFLPRSRNLIAEDHGVAPSSAIAPAESHGCILMVEDDVEVAALVRDMLGDLGFEVIHASGPNGALGALADGRQLDLVFSDIMMPGGKSGIDLAKEIRRRRPELPILLTSGFADRNRDEVGAMGIQILPKPYGLEDLRVAVSYALEGRSC